MNLIEELDKKLNRRTFGKGLGIMGAGVASAALLGSTAARLVAQESSATGTTSFTSTDVQVLNFALNLEYLEAEFYTCAVTGKTLEQAGLLSAGAVSGPTTGCQKVNLSNSPEVNAIAHQIMHDEQQHVLLLRSLLGSNAVKKPTLNLTALGSYSSLTAFLRLARAFEDTGVSAYGGAAPLLSPHALTTAARIALTEAEHAGNIREKMILQGIQQPKIDSLDIPQTEQHFFSVNSQGLAIVRTPSQVLRIVYHGGSCSGGFFPDGFNGALKCAA